MTYYMSNVHPYSIGSDVDKQLYTGESDHITFSMGGTRFSEGFILYETANFMDDNLSSYVVFDLGNEFDHVRFTAANVEKYKEIMDASNSLMAQCDTLLPMMIRQKTAELEYLRKIRETRIGEIDGKTSTATTNYCTLWDTDKVDRKCYIMPIDEFKPKE